MFYKLIWLASLTTINELYHKQLKNQNPKSLSIVSLLSKFDKRKKKINLNYVGFEIENHFVVGYGLDYQENFRNLPTIHAVQFNEKKILNWKRT